MSLSIELCERGLVPDAIARAGIRRLLRQRLKSEDRGSTAANAAATATLIGELGAGPIAAVPEKANEQHYEVPSELFALMLGPNRKYSSCYWPPECHDLADAEKAALDVTIDRAQLTDGQAILELGCGWGSLTLEMARRFPNASITAVSNSATQRQFIVDAAASEGIDQRLTVITADINDFRPDGLFDRVVSVEMFEHMRNHHELMQRIATWLNDEGKLFVHIFTHRSLTYLFEDRSRQDWMSRYFFSGGIMPAADYLARFQDSLRLNQQWTWNGRHYQRTCDAWLANMDNRRGDILPIMRQTYGDDAGRWFQRWRMFHLACSELFGFDEGNEWFVSHYRFEK